MLPVGRMTTGAFVPTGRFPRRSGTFILTWAQRRYHYAPRDAEAWSAGWIGGCSAGVTARISPTLWTEPDMEIIAETGRDKDLLAPKPPAEGLPPPPTAVVAGGNGNGNGFHTSH